MQIKKIILSFVFSIISLLLLTNLAIAHDIPFDLIKSIEDNSSLEEYSIEYLPSFLLLKNLAIHHDIPVDLIESIEDDSSLEDIGDEEHDDEEKQKVEVDVEGTLTEEQQSIVDSLVNSLQETKNDVQIEIEAEVEDDEVEVKKEVEGTLTDDQQSLVDDLTASLETVEDKVKIEIETEFGENENLKHKSFLTQLFIELETDGNFDDEGDIFFLIAEVKNIRDYPPRPAIHVIVELENIPHDWKVFPESKTKHIRKISPGESKKAIFILKRGSSDSTVFATAKAKNSKKVSSDFIPIPIFWTSIALLSVTMLGLTFYYHKKSDNDPR